MENNNSLKDISTQIRRDIIRMVGKAGCGHPGGSMSSADALVALYFSVMKHDPASWTRESRGQDAFILSAGHLAPALYAVLARSGYFPVSELSTLRQFGSRLQGHPGAGTLPGIVQASGSLGQGLACAIGIALGKKLSAEPERVFCLMGDGELEEGEVWESAMFAANHSVDNLVALVDWNGLQIDGDVNKVAGLGDLAAKWTAFGWSAVVVDDGNDPDAIVEALKAAESVKGKPTVLLLRTQMGYGVDFMQNDHAWHGKAPKSQEVEAALACLEETLGDF